MFNTDKYARTPGSVDPKTYSNTSDFKASYTFTGLTPGIMVTLVDKLAGTLERGVWKAVSKRTAKVDKNGHVSFTGLDDSVYSLLVNDVVYKDESIHNVMIGDPRKISRYELPYIFVSLHDIDGELRATDQSKFEALLTKYPDKDILVDVPVNITSNITIPAATTLEFVGDGKLYFTSGVAINFTDGSTFNDSTTQIFDFAADIRVEGVINHDYWRPEWFGAYPDDTSANFAHVINEMFDHAMDPATTTMWYPSVFRFRNMRTYYTTDPVKYRSLAPAVSTVSGLHNEDADIIYIHDTSSLASGPGGICYMWTDIDRWVGITYASKTATSISGCVWSVYHGLSDAEATISDGAGVHRRVSRMNDFVLESPLGSRWGGAILKSAIPESGVANAYGGKVIDAGHTTAAYIPTRCVFRGLRFWGHGTTGQNQREYVCDFSALDLLHVDTCGFFYCNSGIYMRDAGAGAAIVTNSYIVGSNGPSYMVNGMGNCKFDTCIIEQCKMLVGGNSTDPVSFTNCHLEHMSIDVESNRIYLGGSTGTTNSTVITLNTSVCNSYVTIREVGSYVLDHGHYNHIDAGFRYEECEGITSNVVQMAYPSSRQNGDMILTSGVPWLLSLGISKDGAVDASYTDYNFKLWNVSSTDNSGGTSTESPTVTSGTVFKDYGTIEVGGNTSRFVPIWYEQHWDCFVPSGNVMLAPSHPCNMRATRPLNLNPRFRYADIELDGTMNTIPGWYQYGGITTTTSGVGTYMTSGEDGKVRIVTTSVAEVGPYITLDYSFTVQLEMGKTYVAILKGTKNDGTKLPLLSVGNSTSYSNQEYHSTTPIAISGNEYQAIAMFRPRFNRPTKIGFGHLTDPGVMDFTFDFLAVAELGDRTKYISDGLPECGVFYGGDTIYEEFPATNGVSAYLCRSNTEGTYGAKDVGVAMYKGEWVASGSYTQGDWWKYGTRVFCARYSHSGLTELPTYSGSVTWKAIERGDTEYTSPSYITMPPGGSGVFTTVGPAGSVVSHSLLGDLTADDHPQYILVDGTRAFTGTISGITPTADAHLATKGYIDDRRHVSVIDYGADPTGLTDSADAIQAAITAAGGGTVLLNPTSGDVQYGVSRTIRLANDTNLIGNGHFNTKIFPLPAFYANSGASYTEAAATANILDDGGYPVVLSLVGSSDPPGEYPLSSHTTLKDFTLYSLVYSGWSAIDNADPEKKQDSTGVYGRFYEGEIHNVGACGFARGLNIGFNNGSVTGAGIYYYNDIGLRLIDVTGFQLLGGSFVGSTIGVDILNCLGGTFDTHQETSSIAYRVGENVTNAHITLGHAFNIENCPIVIHPNAKVFITGNPVYANMTHSLNSVFTQAEVIPAIDEEYGYINYVPDGDMSDNKLNPTYWTYSGGGSLAALIKRRSVSKYEGTLETLHNYTGKPKLWCYPGSGLVDYTTYAVFSSGFSELGFLDVRFDTHSNIGVKIEILDTGNSDAIMYDSGFNYGLHADGNSRALGERVIAGDLNHLSASGTGPYKLKFTSNSSDGFVISRANMYKSRSILDIDTGTHFVLASGIQAANSVKIFAMSDLADFPAVSGRLTVYTPSNNRRITVTYTNTTNNIFEGCVWADRFAPVAVADIPSSGEIHRYFDDPDTNYLGFSAYDMASGPEGTDLQSIRAIMGTSTTHDIPHHLAGWVQSIGNPAGTGTEHSLLLPYDTTPAGSYAHTSLFIPNSGLGWHFIDAMVSSSYYMYIKKRSGDVRFAGLGILKPIAKQNDKFTFTAVPTEGWWRSGDEILVNGVPYYCSVAGDPGTWVTASGGSSSSAGSTYFPGGW